MYMLVYIWMTAIGHLTFSGLLGVQRYVLELFVDISLKLVLPLSLQNLLLVSALSSSFVAHLTFQSESKGN